MLNWFVAMDGKSLGPMTKEGVQQAIANGKYPADVMVWRDGFADWLPASQVEELQGQGTAPAPPPHSGQDAHEIDYEIFGQEMQFVEVELDPGESVVAEAGSMMYMANGIVMETIFGDGSKKSSGGGFIDKMLGAGKRLLTGEGLFMTMFSHAGHGKARVAFASPYPGKIIPLDLKDYNGTIVCQKDAFLCAAKGVSVGIAFQKKMGTALFGGEGFIMQKLSGDGWCFVHAGGTIIEKELAAGETMRVDTGCLVALTQTVNYDIEFVGNVKSAIFGGEGFFFANVAGPGHVWLQSLPFSRLAGRIYRAAPQTAGSSVGEGSVLGGLSTIFER